MSGEQKDPESFMSRLADQIEINRRMRIEIDLLKAHLRDRDGAANVLPSIGTPSQYAMACFARDTHARTAKQLLTEMTGITDTFRRGILQEWADHFQARADVIDAAIFAVWAH